MFLLTIVFIVLTIVFTQELQGVKTTLPYLTTTAIYYLTTEPLFIEAFTKWSILSKIDMFECREAIYGRLCLKIIASILAFIIHVALLVSMFVCKRANFSVVMVGSKQNSKVNLGI